LDALPATVIPTADEGVELVTLAPHCVRRSAGVGDAEVKAIRIGAGITGGGNTLLGSTWAFDLLVGLGKRAAMWLCGVSRSTERTIIRGMRFERARGWLRAAKILDWEWPVDGDPNQSGDDHYQENEFPGF
jgi:hypothetical protein